MITTFGARLAQLRRTLWARFSFRGHKLDAVRHRGPILITPRRRLFLWFQYLRELKRELCNVCRRMEILRHKHLCLTGVGPLSIFEDARLSPRHRRRLVCARNYGRQKLLSILPEATLVDQYLVTELFHPRLFAVVGNTEAPLRSCSECTESLDKGSNTVRPTPGVHQS